MKKNVYFGLYLVVALLAVLPFVVPNSFYLDLVIRMAINAVIVLGLNLLIGFAGQISLGHAGFLGIGAAVALLIFALIPFGDGGESYRDRDKGVESPAQIRARYQDAGYADGDYSQAAADAVDE